MKPKLVAIGNRLMGDDGIAIKVAESIRETLEFHGIDVVIGETDIYYCLNDIFDVDVVFILDAVYYGKGPGTITVKDIQNCETRESKEFTQHGMNLINLLELYNLNKKIYIIGIEIDKITYSNHISTSLNKSFHDICSDVKKIVLDNVKAYRYD